jgi:hypothetical protein
MNDYRITYTTEAGDSFDSIITERTEAAARKFFTSMNKGLGFTVTNIELHHENTCATKQQERDTLAAIQKMVEELGPQSYLATAFEGCFEDAESNIENDFGDSMKARWLHADAQLNAANGTIEELKERLAESQKDYEAAHAAAHAIAEEKDAEIAALRERIIPADNLTDCKQIAENLVEELRQKVKAAEATILEYAEHPETTTFCDAVRGRKNLTKDIAYYEALVERLAAAERLAGQE